MPQDYENEGVLAHINGLSSAEDIFTYLLMPYDEAVLNVSRLHIMKRFGAYLRDADFAGMDEHAVFVEARQLLKNAYGDFIESTPLKEKVFKVFHDEQKKLQDRFVGIDALKLA